LIQNVGNLFFNDLLVYMLKSTVKICDVTKRRMPMSFMIRFVNTTDQIKHNYQAN
jgi:hypothetical protein